MSAPRGTTRERLEKTSLRIEREEPLDPIEFRTTHNEAREDGISVPLRIFEAILGLETAGWLERTKIGKIEWVGWSEPTDLKTLLSLPPPPRNPDVDAIVADYKARRDQPK